MSVFGFVVIGRNEGRRLAKCLAAVLTYGAPVVYVDSASNDGSPELARQMGATVVSLDQSCPMNASRGRQEGTRALLKLLPNCEFIQFIDGDCVLAPDWIDAALTFMGQHSAAAVVCGRRFEAFPNASIYNRLCDEEWNTPCGMVAASGGDALMRADKLTAVGGFDPTLMASEEPELATRLRAAGWEIWRIDALMTEHDASIFNYRAYWRRSLRGGFGLWQVWRRTSHLEHPINARALLSALFWVVLTPILLVIVAGIIRAPALMLTLPLIYLFQVARMAARKGASDWHNWRAASLVLSIKTAELIGAVRALLARRQHTAIDYKRS